MTIEEHDHLRMLTHLTDEWGTLGTIMELLRRCDDPKRVLIAAVNNWDEDSSSPEIFEEMAFRFMSSHWEHAVSPIECDWVSFKERQENDLCPHCDNELLPVFLLNDFTPMFARDIPDSQDRQTINDQEVIDCQPVHQTPLVDRGKGELPL